MAEFVPKMWKKGFQNLATTTCGGVRPFSISASAGQSSGQRALSSAAMPKVIEKVGLEEPSICIKTEIPGRLPTLVFIRHRGRVHVSQL